VETVTADRILIFGLWVIAITPPLNRGGDVVEEFTHLVTRRVQGRLVNMSIYFVAITALCGPMSGTRQLSAKPASRVQAIQSAPV
jgi:hypothetical protein